MLSDDASRRTHDTPMTHTALPSRQLNFINVSFVSFWYKALVEFYDKINFEDRNLANLIIIFSFHSTIHYSYFTSLSHSNTLTSIVLTTTIPYDSNSNNRSSSH